MIIAVDGPAASGKGTIARALATHFGLPHMDTGLLYRAVGLNLLQTGGDPESEFAVLRACDLSQIDFSDPDLRNETIGSLASRISAYPSVRQALLERQRNFARQESGAVLDGRDIGTVVVRDAEAKLYVTARPEIRAERRHRELSAMGLNVHYEDVLLDIRARDERDSARSAAPLRAAEDAFILDTSDLTIDEAIAQAIAQVETRALSGRSRT